MATGSASESVWRTTETGRPASLVVHLRQRSYVFPWSLFLFAEGTDAEVRATFHTHVVSVEGAGLTALLSDLAAHTVTDLIEPDRSAKFSPSSGPHVTALSVHPNQ